jgi:hypothetical protein
MTLQRLERARRPTVNPPCNASSIHTHIQWRRETIMKYAKMRNMYGIYYSDDAAEALTSQALDG